MSTIADAKTLNGLVERLQLLRPETSRRWGTLTAGEMLCHIGDAHESVLGIRVPPGSPPPGPPRPVLKWMALYGPIPWPKGAKTRAWRGSPTAGHPSERLRAGSSASHHQPAATRRGRPGEPVATAFPFRAQCPPPTGTAGHTATSDITCGSSGSEARHSLRRGCWTSSGGADLSAEVALVHYFPLHRRTSPQSRSPRRPEPAVRS